MAGFHVKFEVTPETFLADLTEAAYRVSLKHGFHVPFTDVVFDLQKALREVIQKDMLASPACGSHECREAERFELSSPEAKQLFKEE